jgi:PAS domain S-box-containing protein
MRVLVVEDNPDLCEVLREFLLDLGHQPLIVHTAEAGLDLLRVERPDVILLDVRLPGMSGLDFLQLQAVRELRVPILVISGHVTESEAGECLRLGAFDFIGKPIVLSRLEELLACLGPSPPKTRSAPEWQAPRRRVPRAPVALPVKIHESNGTEWEAVSVDLSASGIKVRSNHAVSPVPASRLSITLPDGETRLEVVSVLVRADLDGYAFYFLNLTDEQLQRLSAVVQPVGTDQLGPVEPHLRILHTIGQAISTPLDVDEVLRITLDALTHVTGHEISSLHLLTPDGTTLHLRGDRGLRPHLRDINRVLPVGEGVIGRVAATGRTVRLADASESSDLLPAARAVVKQEGIHAFVCVPIRSRGRILGTLSLGRRTREPFSELEVALVEASTHQIGLTLENAQLYAETRRQLEETRQAERALRETADTLQAVIRSSPIAIYARDLEGNVTMWNAAAEQMFGWSEPDVVGRPLRTIPEEKQAESRAFFERIRAGEALTGIEVRRRRKDGSPIDLLLSTALLRDATGVIRGHVTLSVDITERKRAEAARLHQLRAEQVAADVTIALAHPGDLPQALQRCAEAIVRHLDVALARIWILNSADNVLELQASAGMATPLDGVQRRIPVGEFEIGLIAQERRPHLTNSVLDDPRVSDKAWARREGMVAFVGYPLLVDDRLVGVLAAFARTALDDVTLNGTTAVAHEIAQGIDRTQAAEALRQSEEQVRQLQKLESVGRLAGGIAHDFNNLLQVILGRSQLLLARPQLDDRVRRDIDLIETTAHRATALTRQLLAFSRKQILEPQVLDLNEVVPGMATMLQRLIGEDVELVSRPGPTPCRVKVDPSQLEQVVMNLVVNARDAMPRGGRLTIETANVELGEAEACLQSDVKPGSYVMLAVSDTGIGMDAATQARIFEPFFTTKDPGKGTGLGLSVVYGVVTQSGGHIEVESAPGRGATFTIYLPRVEAGEEAAEVVQALPGRGTETILLTEHDDEVRGLAREILTGYGYTVLEACQVADALLIAERHTGPIHLLLTDVVMPQMSARELVERLTPLRPEMQVVYMSGYTDDAMVHHGPLDPGTPFVQKPFTPEALAQKVRDVLDTPDA